MEKKLHYTMGFVGGFMGAYAILNRCDVFGNAQTANMIHLVMNIIGRNVPDVLYRLAGLMIYMSGIVVTVMWPRVSKASVHYISLAADAGAFIVLGFMPEHMNNVVALYPVFFAAAIQWNAFTGIGGYNYSTIFSTNNLRQFTVSVTEYMLSREKKHAEKAKFFGGMIVFYHMGVLFSYAAYILLGIRSIWMGFVPLVIASALMLYEDFYKYLNSGKRFGKQVEEVSSNV